MWLLLPGPTSEQLPKVVIVRSLEKVQSSHISEVGCQLLRIALAQHLNGRGSLGVAYFLVSLLQCVGLETLPWQVSSQEIHEHVPQGLEIIPPALLLAQMSID